jgi:hypothetical protein
VTVLAALLLPKSGVVFERYYGAFPAFQLLRLTHGLKITFLQTQIIAHTFIVPTCPIFQATVCYLCRLYPSVNLVIGMCDSEMPTSGPVQVIEGQYLDQHKLMALLRNIYGTSEGKNNFRVEVNHTTLVGNLF